MHLVSCRHNTSGRIDFRNLATMSMRSRTELMFQVVREKRMGRMYQGKAGKDTLIPEHDRKCSKHSQCSSNLKMIHFSSWPGVSRPSTSLLRLWSQDVDARHRRQVYAVCARQTAMAGHDDCSQKPRT